MINLEAWAPITPDGLTESEEPLEGLGVPEVESEGGARKGVLQSIPCPDAPTQMGSSWAWW
jgi:hypothetical protein